MDWSEAPSGRGDYSAGHVLTRQAQPETPPELEHMLEAEGPSVMECFNASEQASQAIAESTANERKATASAGHESPAPSANPHFAQINIE
jgi:hypothetical protein